MADLLPSSSNDPRWAETWQELGQGAPTLGGLARVCSAAMASGGDPTVVLSPEARAILWGAQQRGLLEVKGANRAFDAPGRMLAVYIETGAEKTLILRNRDNPIVTIRFLAGLGLAGELGAAITLVSEVMTKENRGYGTMIIVVLGALGAVFAALISKMHLALFGFETWQTAYLIGGSLGLLLLFLRFGTFESGMFEKTQSENIEKGNFFLLFSQKERFLKYLSCILVGLPVWYTIGILIKFSNDTFIPLIGVKDKIEPSYPIMFAYIGLSTGDLLSGLLSQWFKSRKKVVVGFLIANFIFACIFVFMREVSANFFYFFCFLLGSATGYWALFVTIASEQFGTNIRATATSTVPNFVRGAVIPITLGFSFWAGKWESPTYGALIVGLICTVLALIGIFHLKETFGKDLNYAETHSS